MKLTWKNQDKKHKRPLLSISTLPFDQNDDHITNNSKDRPRSDNDTDHNTEQAQTYHHNDTKLAEAFHAQGNKLAEQQSNVFRVRKTKSEVDHLEIFGAGDGREGVGTSSDVENVGSLEPWDEEMGSFADELCDLLKSRFECSDFLEKLESAQASVSQNLAEEGNSWDMIRGYEYFDGAGRASSEAMGVGLFSFWDLLGAAKGGGRHVVELEGGPSWEISATGVVVGAFCLMRLVWLERNKRIFQGLQRSVLWLEDRFLVTLYSWLECKVDPDIFSFLDDDGRYHEALGKWEAAITLMPERAVLHEQKAQVLLEIGEAWNALKAATRATELEPSWAEAWITLGRAQLNFGEPDNAIESFDRALAIKPDFVEALDDWETASHLVKKRKQLHSSGSSTTKNRYVVGDKTESS
ncbi:unnamed protein product [Camellia sinensis]